MAERGAFFEGGGGPFPGGKKVPRNLPPSFQKPLICCFAPQGNPRLRDAQRPQKSGKNAAGNGYFVSKVPARQVPLRKGRREGGDPPLASPKKESVFACFIMPPGNACSDSLLLKDKSQPSAGGFLPMSSGHARQQQKRGCPCGQPLMNGFWGRRGSGGGNPFLPLAKGLSSPSLYLS